MTKLAVIGHVEWVDFIPVGRMPEPGDVVHARGAFARAAGGGGVVAGVFAELGAQVDFFCALGDDRLGHAAAEQLGERGISMHVAWRPEPTRRAVTLLEDDGERTIVTIGERLEPHGSDEIEWELLRSAAGAYFTAGDAAALERGLEAGVTVASPRGRHAIEAVAQQVDALVFSARDRDERKWAGRLADHAKLFVETQGAQGGAWWGDSEGSWEPVALAGPRKDAYGCGDSFAAGFTFGLATGAPVAEAAALGAQCAARCLTRPGAP